MEPGEKRFLKNLLEVKLFVSSRGHFPTNKENIRLYGWLCGLRMQFQQGELASWKKKRLDAIGFPWKIKEVKWMANYALLFNYLKNKKHFPAGINYEILFTWLRNQLKGENSLMKEPKFKKLIAQLQVYLTQHRITRKGERREKYMMELKAFRKEYPARVPHSSMPDRRHRALAKWLSGFRERLRKQPEIGDWKEQLAALGIPIASRGEVWQEKFEALRQFIESHGCLPASTHPLHFWLRNQEHQMKRLSTPQKKKLLDLSAATTMRQFLWEKRFEEFSIFLTKHHCHPTLKTNHSLCRWWLIQRNSFKIGHLTPDRARRLKQVTGLPALSLRSHKPWQYRFNQLKVWRKKNPGHWPTYNSSGQTRKLAIWCISQRQVYFRTLKHFLPMPPDHIRQLDGIGFQWRSDRALAGINARGWEKRYAQLKQYVKKQGLKGELTLRPNNSLYQWWQSQKLCFKNNTLRHYRLQKIKQLGIVLK